eukprot:346514_1
MDSSEHFDRNVHIDHLQAKQWIREMKERLISISAKSPSPSQEGGSAGPIPTLVDGNCSSNESSTSPDDTIHQRPCHDDSTSHDQGPRQYGDVSLIPLRARKPASLDIMRVNQCDAVQLDSELLIMLKWQMEHTLKYFPSDVLNRFAPEVSAILNLLIYRFSVFTNIPSPGNRLQNIRYRDEWKSTSIKNSYEIPRARRLAHGFLSIGMEWIWARSMKRVSEEGFFAFPQGTWQRRLHSILEWVDTILKLARLANFIIFLRHGHYRSLTDRILGMRLVYLHAHVARQVSFELMNQQLVWGSVSEFFLFILPLINVPKIRRWVGRQWHKVTDSPGGRARNARGGATPCPLCSAHPITTPFAAKPCGHVYCYVCLRAEMMNESVAQFRCATCGGVITGLDRVEVRGESE